MNCTERAARAGKAGLYALAVPALLFLLAAGGTACTQPDGSNGSATPTASQPSSAGIGAATADAAGGEPDVAVATPEELLDTINAHDGKVVVVKFWATWCKPCVEEMPKTIAFYKTHADSEEVAFVSVSADLTDSINDTVIPFVKEKQIPFPVRVIDAAGPDDIVAGLGIEESGWEGTLPAAFVFDKKGQLSKFWIGVPPEGALDEAVNALIS